MFYNKCKDKRCKACKEIVTFQTATSNVTNREYSCINNELSPITCKTSNFIYLLTCSICNQQYIGETRQELNKRLNDYRGSKIGCPHVLEHKDKCGNGDWFFTFQVLENMPGSGYLNNNEVDEEMAIRRKAREDLWMKRFRTIYPYGLNEKAVSKNSDAEAIEPAIGKLYPSLERIRPRPKRVHKRGNNFKAQDINSIISFFQYLDTLFQTQLKYLSNKIRIVVNRLSKKLSFQIASEIIHPDALAIDPLKEQIYLYVLDLIDSKYFGKNKAPEHIEKQIPKNFASSSL